MDNNRQTTPNNKHMICIKEAEFNSSAHDIAHDFYGIFIQSLMYLNLLSILLLLLFFKIIIIFFYWNWQYGDFLSKFRYLWNKKSLVQKNKVYGKRDHLAHSKQFT